MKNHIISEERMQMWNAHLQEAQENSKENEKSWYELW